MCVDDRCTDLEGSGVGTNEFIDLFPTLEYHKRWHLRKQSILPSFQGGMIAHSTDADLLRDRLLLIYIDFMKLDSSKVCTVRELFKDRGNDSARATPRSPKVNNDDFARADL